LTNKSLEVSSEGDISMNCPNCGGSVPAGNQRCVKCGSFIEQQQAPPQQPQPPQPPRGGYPEGGYPIAGSQKSKLTAGLLGIFLGGIGIHRFYLGYTGIGIVMIVVSLCTWGIAGSIWGLIEGIMIITGNGITTDSKGYPLAD